MGVYERYPHLKNLRKFVSDEVAEKEIGSRSEEFERLYRQARDRIPTVRLGEYFPPELENGSIHLENFLGHWGNHTIETTCKICLIVQWLKPRTILEIGTYNGLTSLQMALNAPDAVVFTIDLPPGGESEIPLREVDRQLTGKSLDAFGSAKGSYFEGRTDLEIRQLFGDSAVFDYRDVISGTVDLVLIDAAKDYDHVRVDTENALDLISDGGVVLWHNYGNVDCPDVTRYLFDLSASLPIRHLVNTPLGVYWAGAGEAKGRNRP